MKLLPADVRNGIRDAGLSEKAHRAAERDEPGADLADGAAVVFTSPADSTYWPAARACKILHPPQPYDGGKHQEDDKKKRNPLQFCCPLGSRGAGFQSAPASISRECDLAHASPPGSSLSPV